MTFADLIDKWTDRTTLAEELGVSYQAVRKMADRNNIRSKHWPKIVESAREHGITADDGSPITMDLLSRMETT